MTVLTGCVIAALAIWVIYLSFTMLTLAEQMQNLIDAHEQREQQHWKAYWGAYKKTAYEEQVSQPQDYAPIAQRLNEAWTVPAHANSDPDVPF